MKTQTTSTTKVSCEGVVQPLRSHHCVSVTAQLPVVAQSEFDAGAWSKLGNSILSTGLPKTLVNRK